MPTSILLALLPSALAGDLTLACGRLFDAEHATLLGPHVVVVRDGRIHEVRAGGPGRGEYIDLSTATCLPGLIDLHVHLAMSPSRSAYEEPFRLNPADLALRAAHNGRLTLEAGFTTVRDLGAPDGVVISLREAISKGWTVGPRIIAAGKSLATDGGHADPTNGARRGLLGEPGPAEGVISGPDEARAAVRERYQEGADVIKITVTGGVLSVARSVDNPQFTDEELAALISAAEDYGFNVAAHAHGNEGARRAVLAGVQTIEHGTWLQDDVLGLMKEHGTWLIPTLTAGAYVTKKADDGEWYPEVVRGKARAVGPQILNTFRRAADLGVRWAFGTDAGVYPHGENAREFELLLGAGISPAVALQSATWTAAGVLGLQAEIGALTPGRQADLVAIDGDPTREIKQLMTPVLVMKGGVVVKR